MIDPDFKSFIGRSLLSLIILSVLNQEGANSGYFLIKRIKKLTNGDLHLTAGTVYPVLESLKDNNLVIKENFTVQKKTEKGIKTKSVYRITGIGQTFLYKEWEKLERLREILNVFSPKKSLW